MKLIYKLLMVATFLLIVSSAEAGFFDQIVKKTSESVEKAVQSSVEEKVEKEVDKALGNEEETETPAPETGVTEETDGVKEDAAPAEKTSSATPYPTSTKAIALAVVKLAPEIFDLRPDRQLKELLLQIFPSEDEILGNEFYWHKNKDSLIQRAIEMAQDAPTTFEVAPWINNSQGPETFNPKLHYLNVAFGQYDFNERAFPVYPPKLEIPWLAADSKSQVALYQFSGVHPIKENQMVPVDIDEAEKLVGQIGGKYQLYSHFTFTLTRVIGLTDLTEHPDYDKHKKYLGMEGGYGEQALADLRPYFEVVIKDNKIDLYRSLNPQHSHTRLLAREDLKYFTSLQL